MLRIAPEWRSCSSIGSLKIESEMARHFRRFFTLTWRVACAAGAVVRRAIQCDGGGLELKPCSAAECPLSRLRAGLSHMEFSNRSSLRTQGPQRERKALIAAARTLASALEQSPLFTFEARGYGSLRSQGRPAERLYEATTDQRTAQFSHMRFPCACGGEPGWGRRIGSGCYLAGSFPPPAALY
jgi:hypothetical protein